VRASTVDPHNVVFVVPTAVAVVALLCAKARQLTFFLAFLLMAWVLCSVSLLVLDPSHTRDLSDTVTTFVSLAIPTALYGGVLGCLVRNGAGVVAVLIGTLVSTVASYVLLLLFVLGVSCRVHSC